MWENAPAFNALLVFAEHRFYGESLPFGAPDKRREFLRQATAGTPQALADYARLVTALKQELGAEGAPVVAFGGSYGGMLVDGGARKLRGGGRNGGSDGGGGGSGSAEGESASSHPHPQQHKQTHQQQQQPPRLSEGTSVASALPPPASPAASEVARRLRVCPGQEPRGDGALVELAWWARAAFDYLAMGNFPYATGYILNSGEVELPPWPLREACSYLADPTLQAEDDDVLLGALADAIGVYYNATGEVGCFTPAAGANNASSVDTDNWNWQACTEMSMPMSTDGKRDMFWRNDWDPLAQAAQCMEQYGVSPGEGWGAAEYGGYASWSQVTNVVFSNGRLDPWSGMGVVDQRRAGGGVKVIMMDQAAHHLDLFFEHPLDPQDVLDARRVEMDYVERWVDMAYGAYYGGGGGGGDTSGGGAGGGDGSGSVAAAAKNEPSARGELAPPSWLDGLPSVAADW
ncbi:unnamed protein product [Ectocarpus sp. CCAP 1310/34]|nr:unnamed protein product [Ectocarpus sp. CCAP 1310/34]